MIPALRTVKTVKNIGDVISGDATAIIPYLHPYSRFFRNEKDPYDTTLLSMPDGIVNQVLKRPFYQPDIGKYKRKAFRKISFDTDILFFCEKLKLFRDILNQLARVKWLKVDIHLPGIKFCQFKELRDKFRESFGMPERRIQIKALFLRKIIPAF